MITFSNFLTKQYNQYRTYGNNTYGTLVGSGVCSPVDALGANDVTQSYPNEKLFSFRQTFVENINFLNGDYITIDLVSYVVRAVNKYDAQFPMSQYSQLIIEEVYGS